MNTIITEVTAEQDAVQDPRDAMMRAFAVAETVVSELPFRPSTITLADDYNGAYAVIIYFHREPGRVREFAAHMDVEASARPHITSPTDTYTSAECTVDGVTVRAWALVESEDVAA